MILVTGGAGFIGSNFVVDWLSKGDEPVVNLDMLTYAGNLVNLIHLKDDPRHIFVQGDINDRKLISALFAGHRPRAVINFAAETHVDRSIHAPDDFIKTNINGTFNLLSEALTYWQGLNEEARAQFRLLHISTDEVYGSLGPDDPPFTESSPYAPNSPYSASKAASDHLVRAFHRTYGLPTLITNCSNNYGPYQFPEKLIPLVILNAVEGKPIPIYGDGLNVRDWLYVGDHCEALKIVLAKGRPGETYNIGGGSEKTNLDVVHTICTILDELRPDPKGKGYSSLITNVKDRPGHDRRYAIDAGKLKCETGWQPKENFKDGIRKTVTWYLEHMDWVQNIKTGTYKAWMALNYGDRGWNP
ncbi:MAG: dTDP-glucose 4,6-dehydratase [Dissulfurimicrobium sp.]